MYDFVYVSAVERFHNHARKSYKDIVFEIQLFTEKRQEEKKEIALCLIAADTESFLKRNKYCLVYRLVGEPSGNIYILESDNVSKAFKLKHP